MKRLALALVGSLALWTAPAVARPVTGCPLRNTPFSTASPVIDLLLSPAARAVVEADAPGLVASLPPQMRGTTPPSFAAIMTLRELIGLGAMTGHAKSLADTDALLAHIDADLRKLPVTAADRMARCARYDNDRPRFALAPRPRSGGHPRLLLFEKINGFRDGPSVDAAHAAFVSLAQENHWQLVTTDRGGAINPATLAQFDAVIWNNISGDVLTLGQRAALKAYITRGGGFLGVHGAAGDPVNWWPWYVDGLIGARFDGHPYPNQFQTARVVLDDPADPLAAGLPKEWAMKEEWYSFRNNPRARGAHVLARLDESTYTPEFMGGKSLRMGADHPIVWHRCTGGGRMFYSAIGHRPEMYTDPIYRRLLTNALGWVAAKRACRH